MHPAELLTAEELGNRLRLSPHTIRAWSKDGKLPTVWLSRTVRRFDLAEVIESLKSHPPMGQRP